MRKTTQHHRCVRDHYPTRADSELLYSQVIPEIDLPGHCYAAINALPDMLLEPDDQSVYRYVLLPNAPECD